MKPAVFRALIALALLGGAAARAGDAPPDYLSALQASAKTQRLAEATGWRKLVHYRKTIFGWASEANRSFYLSPRGADDPEAELEATLAGFFAEPPPLPEVQHPQCQFPARFAWLHGKLGFDFARLPVQRCHRFDEFWGRVSAQSATLVFSSYFVNSPASAFGHTLLRLDKSDGAREGRHFELLDYGVNYSATVNTTNALIYAFKGLFGLYPGQFSSYPYYYKVREYNDYESRDLWEYDLALTPPQVALLIAHLWELGSTSFDYYYISRNCSYHLLAALEAAAPELDLLAHLGHVAVPADTVKVVERVPGLVKGVRYRPSIRSQFRGRARDLSNAQLDAVALLAKDPAAPLPAAMGPAERARVLDASLDLVDLRNPKGILLGDDAAAMQHKQRLLERRSALPVQSEELLLQPPRMHAPDRGHGSLRVGLGGGASSETGPFATVDLRLALHDLGDPPAGYPELAQLEFLPTRLRYNGRARSLWLEEIFLARVASIAPMDRFDQPLSWKMKAGAETLRDGGCAGCLAASFETGAGATLAFLDERLALFALADTSLQAAPHLQGLRGSPVRLGVGPSGGLRARLGDRLVVLGTASWHYLPLAATSTTYRLELGARIGFGRGFALGGQIVGTPLATEGSVAALGYF